MALADCQEKTDVSRVRIAEEGKQVIFLNLDREAFVKTRIDGCLIDNATACDWVVSHDNADLFVELKGTDVDHGLLQILTTAQYWVEHGYNSAKLAALVVCCRYPRVATGVQRAKLQFERRYRGPLHVVPRNKEVRFKDLFDFG